MKNLSKAVLAATAVAGSRSSSAIAAIPSVPNPSSSQRRGAVTQNPVNLQPNEDSKMKYLNQAVPIATAVTTAPAVSKPGISNADKRALNTLHDPSCIYSTCTQPNDSLYIGAPMEAPKTESLAQNERATAPAYSHLRLATSLRRVVLVAMLGLFAGVFTVPVTAQSTAVEVRQVFWNDTGATTSWTPSGATVSENILNNDGAIYLRFQLATSVSVSTFNLRPVGGSISGGASIFYPATMGDWLSCTVTGTTRTCFAVIAGSGLVDGILTRGSYELVVSNLPTPYTVPTNELGGASNPIIFPSTPTDVQVSSGNLSWTQLAGSYNGGTATAFTVYYSDTEGVSTGSTNKIVMGNDANLSCADPDTGDMDTDETCTYPLTSIDASFAATDTRSYRIVAHGSMTLRSELSVEISTPFIAPMTPTNLRVSNDNNDIAWDQAANSYTDFTLYYGTAAGLTTSSTSVTISGGDSNLSCVGGGTPTCRYPLTRLNVAVGSRFFRVVAHGSGTLRSALSNELQLARTAPEATTLSRTGNLVGSRYY